jgi:hypothetical protein
MGDWKNLKGHPAPVEIPKPALDSEAAYLEAPCFSLTRSRVRPNISGVVEARRLTEQMVGLTVELA